MTGDEFMATVQTMIEQMALLYAYTPEDSMERSLSKLAGDLRKGWRKTFGRGTSLQLSDDAIDSTVEDVLAKIRIRRREIEASGTSRA